MKQLILISTLFTALLFTACANSASAVKSDTNRMRFQSVPTEQATLLQTGTEKNSCAICVMNLPTFYKTNHAADTKHGTRQYCSIHCVVEDNELNKTDLKNLRVIDTNSLKFISATDAFYVVGSKKPATMSRISKYAFAKKSDAESFAKEFGGKVMKFYDAYDVATKDFTGRH
jgi:nitrous oxide reductase accessory protein NosL